MRRPTRCAALAALGVSSALRPAVLPRSNGRAVRSSAGGRRGFNARPRCGARRAAEYLANPRFEVLSAAITLLSCAAYAFNTLNDLPETVATALPALERAASAFFLAEYLARFYSRGFDARRGPVCYIQSSRGLMDKASPS